MSATGAAATDMEPAWTVGANIFWQPVKQMKMGWEVNYGETETFAGVDSDSLNLMWGTWFYF